jgi:IS605 OrfB family transposase
VAVLYRSIIQRHIPSREATEMFQVFIAMVNDCVRVCLDKEDYAYETVKRESYPTMMEYSVDNAYRISAMFEASNLLKKFRTDSRKKKVRPPRCVKPFLAVALGVRLEGKSLFLPTIGPIPLTPRSLSVLNQPGISVTSATLTPTSCAVIYHKSVQQIVPAGALAVDVNLDNATTYDTGGVSTRYDLSSLTVVHETYRRVKSRFRRNDRRVKQRLFRKYAAIERDKKSALLHRASAQIVRGAAAKHQGIVLEDLRGLREIYTRASGNSTYYLSKMNAWPFRQLLRQIAYKAEWLGLPVCTVSPEWTSEKCSACGAKVEQPPVEAHLVVCMTCGLVIDRDLNGAKNILKRGLRSRPAWFAGEAMVGGQAPGREPNAKVDADHPSGPRE